MRNGDVFEILAGCADFEWDEHNASKIWAKHQVAANECEQVFFNLPLLVAKDVRHSTQEAGFCALGQTDDDRRLFVVFTVREDRIRVISARDMSRKERRLYQSS